MNKKVIRTFIAVCLMLAMTSSTAFASTKVYNRTLRYKILNNGHYDYLVSHAEPEKVKAYVTGNVKITYDTVSKFSTVELTNLTFTGEDSNKYYYRVDTISRPGHIHVVIGNSWQQIEEIGYLNLYETSSGRFNQSCHNYGGPH